MAQSHKNLEYLVGKQAGRQVSEVVAYLGSADGRM